MKLIIDSSEKCETEKKEKVSTEIEIEREQKVGEKESKMIEKDEIETEADTDTEAKDDESEYESTSDVTENIARVDRKEKETLSTTCIDGITPSAEIISTTPSDLSLTSPQDLAPTSTIKGSQEYITPIITSSQTSVHFFAETADSSSYKSDGPSITSEYDMMIDTEPVILSTPACQVLGIIMNKQLFKNTTATESENDLIRMYFAGKIPREREKNAQQTLEKAVGLAVTRVKSSGLTEGLYNFLNNNREMAISLIIDAMKYRKKEFLPEFWNYNLTIKSSSDLNNPSSKQ